MLWESWVTLAIFVINLIFLLVMAFVSPFVKKLMAKGIGKVYNIIWMCVIIASAAVVMFYNMQCAIGTKDDGSCKRLAVSIVVFLTLLTILNMSWNIYYTIEYAKKKQPTETIAVAQEQPKK